MKTTLASILAILGLLSFGILTGFVGIHYPRIVENEPLLDPIVITEIKGSVASLADGRILELEGDSIEGTWEDFFAPGDRIDLEGVGSDKFIVWTTRPGFVCGTPWARPIRIPLIADDVYRNRRTPVGVASSVKPRDLPGS